MDPAEIEFIAEDQNVEIIPKFNHLNLIHLISGIPAKVPLWLAINLKQRQKCRLVLPTWMNLETLTEIKEEEKKSRFFIKMPSDHYMEMSHIILDIGADDIPNVDLIRTLIKDIWDLRISKLRSSIDTFVKSGGGHATLNHLTQFEINSIRNILCDVLDTMSSLKDKQCDVDLSTMKSYLLSAVYVLHVLSLSHLTNCSTSISNSSTRPLPSGSHSTHQPKANKQKGTTSLFSKFNITLFENKFATTKKKKKTNAFGYEDYSSVTIESMYYDTTVDFDPNAHVHYNFTTQYPNNRIMYRLNRWMRLSVARAIERHYKPDNYTDVLVMCGSGTNGLYGMVTARHLKLMGYDPTIFLVNEYNASRPDGFKLFTQLKKQVLAFNIPILSSLPSNISHITATHSLIVDAVFGVGYDRFKYAALPRNNKYRYAVNVLRQINKVKVGRRPIVSIDLPSHHINPEMLVSLIAPKLGVVEFFGKYHYVAGNYLPSILNEKYQVYVPRYNGSDCLIPIETQVEETTETAEMYHV
ncbi:hypothetical protein M8J76_008148 [Diaphorina citri]|nr:hypothetical protein M8J76_008148 [Diaphorina citri]